MASKFGTLFVDLIARIAGFETDMGRAARIAEQRSKQIERSIKGGFNAALGSVTAFATGLVAGFVSVNAAIQGFNQAIDRADKLDELSQRLNISASQLGEWGYAAQLSGSSIESLETGLTRLSRALAAAENPNSRQAALFRSLGVTAKSAQEALPQLADAFQSLNDQTLETAVAMELFGRGGAELLEFLNRGSGGIGELGDEFQRLGGISDETAAEAASFKDEMDRLKLAVGGVFTQIAADLLPTLKELVVDFRETVREGNLAANVVSTLTAAFRAGVFVIDAYNTAVAKTSAAIETIVNASEGFAEIQRNIGIGGAFDEGSIAAGAERVRDAFKEGDKALERINNRTQSLFRNVRGSVAGGPSTGDEGLESRIGRFFETGGREQKKKGGKSDAEKETEALIKSYESLAERQKEQIDLFGITSEAATVRYQAERDGLDKINPALFELVTTQAAVNDEKREAKELADAAAKAVEKETEAYKRQQESTAEFIEDLQFELALYGMTNKERERAIALRYANVDAMSAEGQEIMNLTDALGRAAEQEAMWNGFKDSLSDAFVDLATGAKSAKDVLVDFFDSIAEQITRSIAENWADTIGDLLKGGGSSNSSDGGNWFGNFLGALWGGGKASGGMALPGMMYEVNERGFEMASVGGRDYMMVGSQPVEITPNHNLGGGGGGTFNFQFAAPTSLKTQKQVANKVSYEQRRARGYA